MRLIIISLTIFLTNLTLFGQDLRNDSIIIKNQLSIELGGAGGIGSLNFERLINVKSNNKVLFRVGLSYLPLTVNNKRAFWTPILPFGFYYLNGIKHHLELGLNNSLAFTIDNISNKKEFHYILMPSIGYRFENFYKKSIYFAFAYSLVLSFNKDNLRFGNWLKIEVGHSF